MLKFILVSISVSKPDVCPSTNGLIGICVEECSSNADCKQGQTCCSNGCGHTCMDLSQIGMQANDVKHLS